MTRARQWWVVAALILLTMGFGIWALGFSRTRQDKAWDRIQSSGVLTVATDASYPPFSALDENGDLFGFDVDLADEIGRRWGVQVAFENITYDALLGTLVVGRDDAVLSAFVPQPDRTREIAFTRAYFVGGTVAVTRIGAHVGERLTSDSSGWAAGKTLAVEYGAGGDALARRWARRAVGLTVLPKTTAGEALQAVASGEADAALVDSISAYDFLRNQPALALAGPPLEPEPYVIAVSTQSPVLFRKLEAALAAIEADGTLPALRVKWFGEAAR